MPIVYLNKRQKAELVVRLAKAKSAARTVKQLREAVNFKELEDIQDQNQEILEGLVQKGIIPELKANVSKALAKEHGIVLMSGEPDKVEMDKTLIENVLAKLPKEEDLDGADWAILDIRETLEDALVRSKSDNKKVVETSEDSKQAETNA